MFVSLKNNRGFTLIETIVSLVIASVALVAIINLFSIDLKINNLKYAILNENDISTNSENIRAIMKESLMNVNGVPANNLPLNQTNSSVTFYTTFFSKSTNIAGGTFDTNNSGKLYTIAYINNQIIIYPTTLPSAFSVLIDNVTNCNISYYDSNLSSTTTTANIRLVSFDIDYLTNKIPKNTKILAKMMQET